MKRRLGWISPVAAGRAPHKGTRTRGSLAGLPERVMLEHLPPVFDQGGVGSCTAQALALAIVALHPRAGYAPETPDRASLYRREREMIGTVGEDSGALISDGVALLDVGWDKEFSDPGGTWGERWTRPAPALTPSSPRLVSAEPLDFDVATIATELAGGHPVVVGIQVTEDWMDPSGDTLPEPSGPSVGGHAVCLVGYDLGLRAWRVRNSWGEGWGDGGEAWLPFAWTSAPWCGEVFALRAVRHVRGLAVTDAADDLFPPKELEPVPRAPARDPLDGMEAQVQRALAESAVRELVARLARGTARPAPLPDGEAVTVWSADGLRTAVANALPLLRRTRPAIVQLHAGPQGLTEHLASQAALVRAAVPGVRLWVGVAWDGWVDDVAQGADVRRIVERVYLPAARAAQAIGAELLVINSEAAGKLHPKAARALGCAAIDAIRIECPGLLLAHTAYDHADFHDEEPGNGLIDGDDTGYPWSAYYGAPELRGAVGGLLLPASGPVDLGLPQVYAAPAKDPITKRQPMASVGALLKRAEGSAKSFTRAVAAGWIDPRVPQRPYVQAHHVRAQDTAGHCARARLACLWAAPTRLDDEGVRALEILTRGRRGELGAGDVANPVVIAWAQGRLDLVPDARWGDLSTQACRAHQQRMGILDTGTLTAATLVSLRAT